MANRANRESRAEEYLRRMKALGYEPSLAGMDDDDIEWELERMDGGRDRPEEQGGHEVRQGVDRDFAERILKMFERKFDRNWRMPDFENDPSFVRRAQVDKVPRRNVPNQGVKEGMGDGEEETDGKYSIFFSRGDQKFHFDGQ